MKIFISYKQTGIEKQELNLKLNFLNTKITPFCNNSYCLWIDDKPNFYKKELLIEKLREKIINSDIVIWLIDNSEKSEWQLLELWMAYSLWKRIILLVRNKVKDNYYLTYWTTTEIHYFNELENLNFKKILW